MKNIFKISMIFSFIFLLVGCSSTEPRKEKTTAEKTAFLIDTIVATAIYNDTNFGAGKDFVTTKSKTNSNTISNTSYTNGGTVTNTVTKSKTKTKSKGFGYGIGY